MSRLSRLKSDWDSLAQRDALAAILTDQSKSDGKWDVSEFMATEMRRSKLFSGIWKSSECSQTGTVPFWTSGVALGG